MSYFRSKDHATPCWHCSAFAGMLYRGSASACARGGIQAQPATGCAFWVREVGADDEPGPPVLDTVPPWPTPKHNPSAGPSKR